MDIILLKVIYKLASAIDKIFPNVKNLNSMQIGILATVILSVIVAIFLTVNRLLKKTLIEDSLDLFMSSFSGGLLGGFTGIVIGLLLGGLAYLIIPPQSDFGLPDIFYALRLMALLFVCWLVGVISGGIVTIKPLIRLLLCRNKQKY